MKVFLIIVSISLWFGLSAMDSQEQQKRQVQQQQGEHKDDNDDLVGWTLIEKSKEDTQPTVRARKKTTWTEVFAAFTKLIDIITREY